MGKEKFFKLPSWWSFNDVERGSFSLAISLERLMQVGFMSCFLKLHDSTKHKAVKVSVKESVLMLNKSSGPTHDAAEGTMAAVTLEDPLIRQSFFLLLYGASAAVLGIAAEIFAKLLVPLATRADKNWRNC